MPLAKTLPGPAGAYENLGATYIHGFRSIKGKSEPTWKSVFRHQENVQTVSRSFGGSTDEADVDGFVPFTRFIQVAKVPVSPTIKKQAPARTKILQKWEGVVLHKRKDCFQARLYETHDDFPTKIANFKTDVLSEEERLQVEVGAHFVWTISAHDFNGTIKRESTIYFRRYVWDENELIAAKQKAETLSSNIAWE